MCICLFPREAVPKVYEPTEVRKLPVQIIYTPSQSELFLRSRQVYLVRKISLKIKVPRVCTQLKNEGTQKRSPFCSALQLPLVFKMLSRSYNGGFFGELLLVCDKLLPQSLRDKPCAQSARRQRPCCRPLTTLSVSYKMNMPPTQVALVARPCALAAQLAEALPAPEADLPKVMAASRPWI